MCAAPSARAGEVESSGSCASKPGRFRRDVETLLGLLKDGRIKPIIAQRLPLQRARRAHEMLGEGGVLGKIVLLPNG
jgi:NADPH2:quinone reductase